MAVFLPGECQPTRDCFLASLEECCKSSYQICGSLSDKEEASDKDGNVSYPSTDTQCCSILPSPFELGDLLQNQNLCVCDDILDSLNVLNTIETEHNLRRKVDIRSVALVFKQAELTCKAVYTAGQNPSDSMMELVYNEDANTAFLEQQSWLCKFIWHLDALVACRPMTFVAGVML